MLGAYIFIIVLSSSWVDPLIIMYCLSLSLFMAFTLKSILSDMSIAAAAAKSLQSCPTLCNLIDGSPPGSAIPGILQARTPEWIATPVKSESEVAQSFPTSSDPMVYSLAGSSVHGIFQAFTFSLYASPVLRWVSCRQHM